MLRPFQRRGTAVGAAVVSATVLAAVALVVTPSTAYAATTYQYRTDFLTGTGDGAGTDDNVQIRLLGVNGNTAMSPVIDTPADDFEQFTHTYYNFPVQLNHLGEIWAIDVRYTDDGPFAAPEKWWLVSVKIKVTTSNHGADYRVIETYDCISNNWVPGQTTTRYPCDRLT